MEAVQLNEKQKDFVLKYAFECHPKIPNRNHPDLKYLMNSYIIHEKQDHITDRGAAYAVTQCQVSFSDFIDIHKWQRRMGFLIEIAKNHGFNTRELLDIFFYEKYKILIKYDAFQAHGGEDIPKNLKVATAEVCINLLKRPEVPLEAVKNYFTAVDFTGEFRNVQSKEEMIGILSGYLNEALANKERA